MGKNKPGQVIDIEVGGSEIESPRGAAHSSSLL